jgi:putative component of membrane protein insertase Oxa1/YidC/SpoIIIJ protein YidD
MPGRSAIIKLSSILVFIVFSIPLYAQDKKIKDDLLLVDSLFKQQSTHGGKRPYIFKNQRKNFKNSNPASLAYAGSLFVYQNYVSQHLSADCMYSPSCSDFSKQAVKQFGLAKGVLLSFDRLGRCNRIAATDLKMSSLNPKTGRFDDPVKNYK